MKILRTENSQANEKGFMLVEIAVSLFVVGLVLLIYAAASNSVVLNRNSEHQQIANRIAVSEMEDLRHMPFASLPTTGPFTNAMLSSLPDASASLVISDETEHLKKAIVTVSWHESGNPNIHQVSLTTLIAEHGL